MKIQPIKDSIKAKVHDPVYTVHRYFARRPHNVINNLINYYTKDENSIIYDPFGGGGTMLYESLVCGQRAITNDTSDLACFVIEQEASMPSCNVNELSEFVDGLMEDLELHFGNVYSYQDREMYWLTWSSYTNCPSCNELIYLSPDTSLGSGNYKCNHCERRFKPKCVPASDIKPVEICCADKGSIRAGKAQNPSVIEDSNHQLMNFYEQLVRELEKKDLTDSMIPKTEIPDCNLQRESALHKKGFNYFEQFLPKATRAVVNYIGDYIMKSKLSYSDKKRILFVLSASLRYCSRFSCMNVSWRGEKRPMEWAKSNFWTPYTFVEVNPIITFYERWESYKTAVKSAQNRIMYHPVGGEIKAVLNGEADYSILKGSSEKISNLPNDSVNLIITDPPYGSYLHYGELSAFWTTWLSKFLKEISPVPDRTSEAVPARKKGYPGWKNFSEYEVILTNVFTEGYRVLKNEHYCVVTFNNKEPEAWIAFLRSVKRAGFILPKNGVIFQDGVEVYKKTIDSRRGGAIFGDFIYSFYKDVNKEPIIKTEKTSWRLNLEKSLKNLLSEYSEISNVELYTKVYLQLLPELYDAININSEDDTYLKDLNFKNFESKLNEYYQYQDGKWVKR